VPQADGVLLVAGVELVAHRGDQLAVGGEGDGIHRGPVVQAGAAPSGGGPPRHAGGRPAGERPPPPGPPPPRPPGAPPRGPSPAAAAAMRAARRAVPGTWPIRLLGMIASSAGRSIPSMATADADTPRGLPGVAVTGSQWGWLPVSWPTRVASRGFRLATRVG